MARLPLIHKQAAERGERGELGKLGEPDNPDAGELYLHELAGRLRNNPTPDECEVIAKVLEKIAAHPNGLAAAGFAPPHRPPVTGKEFRIWKAVSAKLEKGLKPTAAYKSVAGNEAGLRGEKLSASRVKEIFLRWNQAQGEASALD